MILVLTAGSGHAQPRAAKPPVQLSLFPVRLLWQAPLGAPAGASPAHDDRRLFVALRSGSLAALDMDTGASLWTVRVEARGPMAADGSRLFVPTEGALEALDAATGLALWRLPLSSGTVVGLSAVSGWVLALFDSGALLALRANNGDRLWQREIPPPVALAPHVAGDRVFVATRDGTVRSLRIDDGEPVWTTTIDGEVAGFASDEKRLYFGTRGKFFYCLDGVRGRIDWRWHVGAQVVGAPALDERHVYLVALDNQVRALDRRNGAQRWRKPVNARPIGTPLPVGNGVVPALLAPELRGLAARDGANQGRYPVDRELAVAPVVAVRPYASGGDIVIILLSDGLVLALQRRIEPPLVPLAALPGLPVPLMPAQTSAPPPAPLR